MLLEQHIEQVSSVQILFFFFYNSEPIFTDFLTFHALFFPTVWECRVRVPPVDGICCSVSNYWEVSGFFSSYFLINHFYNIYSVWSLSEWRRIWTSPPPHWSERMVTALRLETFTAVYCSTSCRQFYSFIVLCVDRNWSTCCSVAERFLTSLTVTWSWTRATGMWRCWRESKASVKSVCCPCLNITTSVRWDTLLQLTCWSGLWRFGENIIEAWFKKKDNVMFDSVIPSGRSSHENPPLPHLGGVQWEPLQCALWPAEGAVDQSWQISGVWPLLLWWTGQSTGRDSSHSL